ncbi:MAG: protein translocase subunit SecF [Gammaproteobacteria bacterium]|nr:protein translocase subunit SecF [Gammaproteobacteria bacterium]MYF37837.1 protein translocase subunit SecF [Gammaproteobacteria bacterium]
MNIDFMSNRIYALVASAFLFVVSVVSLLAMNLNWGLDFTGGVLVEVGFEEAADADDIRVLVEDAGYQNAQVQNIGSERDIVIRVPPVAGVDQSVVGDEVYAMLAQNYSGTELLKSDYVGPAVGQDLTQQGALALLIALLLVMVYIMFRFTGKFALGAVFALVHDIVIVAGVFSIMRWTFNLPELAALLAVIGYSLNDTIVVSDRIRENFRAVRRGTAMDVINYSLNQTLGRTLVTSLTTLLVLVALLIAGGEQLFGFAIALTIGVIVGTYSSIYIAASSLLLLGIKSQELALPEKEGAPTTR